MSLPVRIRAELAPEPVIAVDGAWGAPGLNLSHWPGHATPELFRHDLSTGCALRFAALAPAERARWAEGCVAIQNNHYDTDGTCAIFALVRPEEALARADRLLDAARAGDFFGAPSDDAFALDRIVAGLADPAESPLELAGLDDEARWQRATEHLIEALPDLLDGRLEPYRALFAPALERLHADRALLSGAARDDLVHLDWTVWTGAGRGPFDPGRHALFDQDGPDRVLLVGPGAGGTTYRLILSTYSWFDLVSRDALARPDLEGLAAALNAAEGTAPADERAWRAHPTTSASPELWFGAEPFPRFAEHAPVLRPSRLEPAVVRARIADALRSALVLPE